MNNRILALMAGTLATIFGLQAQTITLRDQVTNEPITGAVLTCVASKTTVTTDASGTADITPLKDCGEITVDHISFKALTLGWAELSASPQLSLTYRVDMLREVVTSASRFEEKRRDVPERIDVIKARDIRLMDQPTMAELLQNTGTVFVQKSQLGGGSPNIRGFEANRILLVVDGVRMNNAIYRAGHVQDIITVDQSMLERVEVVSGPNSVAYGSDALGGTIHMITRMPKFKTAGGKGTLADAYVRFGTAATEMTAHAGFELRGEKVTSFTSITASDFGDLRQGSTRSPFNEELGAVHFQIARENGEDVVKPSDDRNVQYGTAYKQIDLLEKLRIRGGENSVHQLNIQYSTSSDVPRYDRLSLYSLDSAGYVVPVSAEWYYGPQKRLLAAYTLELTRTSGFFDKARFTPSYQNMEQSRNNRKWNSSGLGVNNEKVGVLGFNADLEKKAGKNEFRYGAEYTNNDVQSEAYKENIKTGERTYRTTRYPGGGSTMSSIAAYVSHTAKLSEKFVISEGLRFTSVQLESTFNDTEALQYLNGTYTQSNAALTWRAGAMFMPGHEWRFSALASTGFRAPNVDDMGKVFEFYPGVIVVPNTDLLPETTTNFEVAISKTFDKRITFDLNGFYTLYDNALSIGNATLNGEDSVDVEGTLSQVTSLTNKTEAYLYGASGQFTAHFDDHFTLRSGATFTFGRIKTDTTDAPLDHIPPVYGRTGLEYQANKLRLEAYVVYNGWKRLRDFNQSPGSEDNLASTTPLGVPSWYTLNARGSYAFTKNVALQLAVENIADDFYRTFASGTSAPGRNLTVSLRANF